MTSMNRKQRKAPPAVPLLGLVLLAACGEDPAPAETPPGPDALSTALKPTRQPAYYVAQALKYFDTLDTTADPKSVPQYSDLVARYEWPPWLYLTGYKKQVMIDSTKAAVAADPSTVPTRQCEAFATQPFARCYVVFKYKEGSCPIYEEFTFNNQGLMTFIEAWSDLPGMMPMDKAKDRWAQGAGIRRLSTKVPGLGNDKGLIDLDAQYMKDAAAKDKDVADFVCRAENFMAAWLKALQDAGQDLYKKGCGWKK